MNASVGASATVGTTTVRTSTSKPGPNWGQTTQAGIGASVDVCLNPPSKKDAEKMECSNDDEGKDDRDAKPDNASAGVGRNLGISVHKDGSICLSFGPSFGLPAGVGWGL